MPRTKPPPAPRPQSSAVLAMNMARQRTAAGKVASDVISRLHHLDDAALYVLAREVGAELREREMTAARETMAADDKNEEDRRGHQAS